MTIFSDVSVKNPFTDRKKCFIGCPIDSEKAKLRATGGRKATGPAKCRIAGLPERVARLFCFRGEFVEVVKGESEVTLDSGIPRVVSYCPSWGEGGELLLSRLATVGNSGTYRIFGKVPDEGGSRGNIRSHAVVRIPFGRVRAGRVSGILNRGRLCRDL